MRQRVLSHLTYANVMVTVLAFVVFGGGTALAAYVVSSNSQVAPGTISGHAGSAANKNIIASSVTGVDIANNGLTGADIAEPSLAGTAHKLIDRASPSAGTTNLATVGPYTIKGQCFNNGIQLNTRLVANGPAGSVALMDTETANDNPNLGGNIGSRGFGIPANTNTAIVGVVAEAPDHNRVGGTAFLRSGSELVQVDFDLVADSRSPRTCFIYGTATRAT